MQEQKASLSRLNAAQRDISAYRQQQMAIRATSQSQMAAQQRAKNLARQIASVAVLSKRLNNEFRQACYRREAEDPASAAVL